MSEFPPLRVREADSDPNVIPVFELVLSNNLSAVKGGPGVVTLSATTGASGGAVYAATANQYLTMAAAGDLTAERILQAGTGLTLFDLGANNSAGFAMIVPVSVTSGGTGASTAFPTGSIVVSSAAGTYTQQNASLAFDIATQTFLIGGTTAAVSSVSINSAGAVVFNEQGSNVDFRIESDVNTAGLVLTGSTNIVEHGIGAGGARVRFGGALDVNGSSVANAGTADVDLIAYTMPANTFNRTGQAIHYVYRGIGANNAATKTVNVRFGSNLMVAQNLATTADTHWWGDAWIIRTGANSQRWFAVFNYENLAGGITLAQDSGASTVTDTNDISIRVSAQSTNNSDITQTFHIINFYD